MDSPSYQSVSARLISIYYLNLVKEECYLFDLKFFKPHSSFSLINYIPSLFKQMPLLLAPYSMIFKICVKLLWSLRFKFIALLLCFSKINFTYLACTLNYWVKQIVLDFKCNLMGGIEEDILKQDTMPGCLQQWILQKAIKDQVMVLNKVID